MATARSKMTRTKTIALLGLMVALTIIFCFVPIQFGPITLALMILPTLIVAQVCGAWTSVCMGIFMGLLNYVAWFTTKAASPIAPIFQNPLVCILPRVLIAVVSYWTRVGLETLIIKKCMKITPTTDVVEEDEEDVVDTGQENVTCNDEMTKKDDEVQLLDEQNADCENITLEEGVEERDEIKAEKKADDKSKKAKEILARQGIHLVSTALGVITNTVFVAIFTLIFFNGTTLGNTIINVEYILAWFGLNFAIEVVSFSLITPPITLAIKSAKLV